MRATDEQFLSLLRPEQGKMFRIARGITGQESDAWDIIQEATLAAYDQFHRLRGGPEAFGPWIRRILVNRARNFLKARSRLVPLEVVTDGEHGSWPGPEEQLDHNQLWSEVMALDEHHRQVLVLRFLVDMTVEEIARVLDVPPGTVKSRIHRALTALRKRLETGAKGAKQA